MTGTQGLASIMQAGRPRSSPKNIQFMAWRGIFEREFFRLSQYFVTFLSAPSKPTEIQVVSEDENDSIRIIETSSDVDFVTVEVIGNTMLKIGFKDGSEIIPGYYSVTAKIENVRKRSSLAKMTVYVPSTDK